MSSFIQRALTDKLDIAVRELNLRLMVKYKAEFETALEKVANRLAKDVAANLVIDDKGEYLSVTLPSPAKGTDGIMGTTNNK